MFLFYTLVIKSKGRCLLLSRHCVNFLSFDPHNHHVNQLFPGLQGRDSALMGPTTRPRPHSQEVEDWDLNSDLSSRGQTASLSQGGIRSPYGFQDSRGLPSGAGRESSFVFSACSAVSTPAAHRGSWEDFTHLHVCFMLDDANLKRTDLPEVEMCKEKLLSVRWQ